MKRYVPVALCLLGIVVGTVEALGGSEEELVHQLGLTKYAPPVFPPILQREGVTTGSASVIISHDAAGRPLDVFVVKATHPDFGEAVIEAAQAWRFAPLPAGGPRRQCSAIVRFEFTVKGVIFAPMGSLAPDLGLTLFKFAAGSIDLPTFDQLDAPPRAMLQPMPRFPPVMIGRAEHGWASVSFLVDENGRVRVPVVLTESAPAFGDAALVAVANWRFETPRKNGRSVIAAARWEFHFSPAPR